MDTNREKTAATVDENCSGLDHQKLDQRAKVSPKLSSGTTGNKTGQKVSSSNSKHGKGSGGRSEQRSSSFSSRSDRVHDLRATAVSKQQEQSSKSLDPRPSLSPPSSTTSDRQHLHSQLGTEEGANGAIVGVTIESPSGFPSATPSIPNGSIVVRSSSANSKGHHVHVPTGKKQATVKAVPRSDLPPVLSPPPEGKEKLQAALEALQLEFKSEHAARLEAELNVSQLELEVKKLKADLQVGVFIDIKGVCYAIVIVNGESVL